MPSSFLLTFHHHPLIFRTTNSYRFLTPIPSHPTLFKLTKSSKKLSYYPIINMTPSPISPFYSFILPLTPSLSIPPQSKDIFLTGSILVGVSTFLLICQQATSAGFLRSSSTRKLIHVVSGPAFLSLWPFYTDDIGWPRLLAALIPLLAVIGLAVSGTAHGESSKVGALGRSVSRGGKAKEALQGPLYYCLVLLFSTLFLFRSPVAVIAIMQLSCGDAAAEVFGRRYGKSSQWGLSWTGNKSIAGTVAFIIAAFLASYIGLEWTAFWKHEITPFQDWSDIAIIGLISVVCSIVELLPVEIVGDDNITIALSAVGLSLALFKGHML